MQKHILYRFISFALLPVAALLLAFDLLVLLSALANPSMLLTVFTLGCVCIYVFTSFTFLNRGISQGRPCKPSLKDWIKVNAIVTAIFVAMTLTAVLITISDPAQVSTLVDRALEMQDAGTPHLRKDLLLKMTKGMLYFFGALSALLAIHIVITLRLLKKYQHVFAGSSNDPEQ